MYAIVNINGTQARVQPDEVLEVHRLKGEPGQTLTFDQVLMVSDGDAVKLGNPLVSGAKVSATVLGYGRGQKVKIFKLRRRKHYQRTQGHRQNYTEIRVDAIA